MRGVARVFRRLPLSTFSLLAFMDVGPLPREHFAEPPLAEFVLEFQFDLGESDDGASAAAAFDASQFRAFYAAVRDYFPVAQQVETAAVNLEVSADAAHGGAAALAAALSPDAVRDAVRRSTVHRFGRRDRGMVLTVGPDLLGLSVLPRIGGYPGWEVVRDLALRMLQIHRSLWGVGVLRRIGLRYINVIAVTPTAFRLRDYVVEATGLVPPRLLDEVNPFHLGFTHVVSATPTEVYHQTINLSAGPAAPPSPDDELDGEMSEEGDSPAPGGELVFSIDQRFTNRGDADPGETDAVCNILHDAASRVFMELLAPDVRSTFKPKPLKELAPI